MKRIFFIIVLLLTLGAGISSAQDNNTTPPPPPAYPCMGVSSTEGPRFEIVRTPSGSTPFYRIDKFTGEVLELQDNSRHEFVSLKREPSENDIAEDGTVSYQLTVESSCHCYLMNLNTGVIWEYSAGKLIGNNDTMFRLLKEK